MASRINGLRQNNQGAAEEGRAQYEMAAAPSGNSALYAEIASVQDAINQYDASITRISELQTRSLNALDEDSKRQNKVELEALAAEIRTLGNVIKERIQKLAAWPASGRTLDIRNTQTKSVKEKFVGALQRYQTVERQFRDKQKQQVVRQFKIVKPDATAEETEAVMNDPNAGSNEIFAQAVSSSARFGQARNAQREVQERHEDFQRIERTLNELLNLFNDMGALVLQQGETVDQIEKNAEEAEMNTGEGDKHLGKAVISARNARRMRWICFIICLVIVLVLGLALGLYFRAHH